MKKNDFHALGELSIEFFLVRWCLSVTLAPFNLNSYVVLICNYIPSVGDKVEESTNFKFDFLEANFLAGLLTEFNFLFIMSVPLTNGGEDEGGNIRPCQTAC